MKKKILIISGVVLVLAIAIFTYLYQTYDIPKKNVEIVHAEFRAEYIEGKYGKILIDNMEELKQTFDYKKSSLEFINGYNDEFFEEKVLFIHPYREYYYISGDIIRSYINYKNELIIECEAIKLDPNIPIDYIKFNTRPAVVMESSIHAYYIPGEIVDRYNLSAEKIKIKYIPKYVTKEEFARYRHFGISWLRYF